MSNYDLDLDLEERIFAIRSKKDVVASEQVRRDGTKLKPSNNTELLMDSLHDGKDSIKDRVLKEIFKEIKKLA